MYCSKYRHLSQGVTVSQGPPEHCKCARLHAAARLRLSRLARHGTLISRCPGRYICRSCLTPANFQQVFLDTFLLAIERKLNVLVLCPSELSGNLSYPAR
ncbi:hypothetical protein BDQ12DRAFT_25712 [Crucibulum laeve]|uniref:Uncharacterized protein n=1 Tax=Crucibulum laeve TaxID=68775 RepID=A0A5C3MGQ6_9AGAR|nr:hypothetical protein BDQ12DRAFT_25712 [Crucibulum laeve]